jgi:hypothetical protein
MSNQFCQFQKGDPMNELLLERIQREAGIPELIDVLVERLAPTDLQSLLLEVYRRRAGSVQPGRLLERYAQDRFGRPSALAPHILAAFDRLAWSLLPAHYTVLELSPVCPLGTNAGIATVDQNKVLTTLRNSEVVADATTVLALECAVRRRLLLRQHPRSREKVCLCSSHRVLRTQAQQAAPGVLAHFRLFGLASAGRDEGSLHFEVSSLREQIAFYLQVLRAVSSLGYQLHGVRVALTPLAAGQWTQVLSEQVLRPLMADYPDTRCALDPGRQTGRGYYTTACFHISATTSAGNELELVDGGFTTWTQQLLSNQKERLLISGLGTERLCSLSGNDGPIRHG